MKLDSSSIIRSSRYKLYKLSRCIVSAYRTVHRRPHNPANAALTQSPHDSSPQCSSPLAPLTSLRMLCYSSLKRSHRSNSDGSPHDVSLPYPLTLLPPHSRTPPIRFQCTEPIRRVIPQFHVPQFQNMYVHLHSSQCNLQPYLNTPSAVL